MCERLEEELLLTSQSSKFGHVRTRLLLRPVLAFDAVVLERHVRRREDEAQELSAPLRVEVMHRVARHRALGLMSGSPALVQCRYLHLWYSSAVICLIEKCERSLKSAKPSSWS